MWPGASKNLNSIYSGARTQQTIDTLTQCQSRYDPVNDELGCVVGASRNAPLSKSLEEGHLRGRGIQPGTRSRNSKVARERDGNTGKR